MALCCCFFVSLKIPSSGLVIGALSKGGEGWALEKLWWCWAEPLCPGGVVWRGRALWEDNLPQGHKGLLAFLLQPWAPTGTAVAREGTGLPWLSPGHSCSQSSAGRPQAPPGVTQAGKGRVSSALTHRLFPSGVDAAVRSHQQAVPGPAGLPDCPQPRGFLSLWVWSRVPQPSPGQLISAEGLTHHRAGLGCFQSVCEMAPESPTTCLGDQRDMTCTLISALLNFCSSNFQARAPGYFSYRWLVVCFSRQDEHSPASHAIWAREPSLPLGRLSRFGEPAGPAATRQTRLCLPLSQSCHPPSPSSSPCAASTQPRWRMQAAQMQVVICKTSKDLMCLFDFFLSCSFSQFLSRLFLRRLYSLGPIVP